MSQLSQNTSSSLEEANSVIDEIKAHLQILPNGFSADYKNKITVLYIVFSWKYWDIKDFQLPNYDEYIEDKVSIHQAYHSSIDLKDVYYKLLSQEEISKFNERVWEINACIKSWGSEETIREKCNKLIQDFLTNTLDTPIDITLEATMSLLDNS